MANYNQEEEKLLSRLVHAGNDVPSIALRLNRTTNSVHSKINSMKRHDFWTADRVGQLKTLWGKGDSTADIAEAMGTTRQAIAHKVKRLGLVGVQPYKKSSKSVEFNFTMELLDDGVTIDELKPRSCRYIHYDQDIFCGQDIVKGSFCATHSKVCYVGKKIDDG